MTIKLADVAKKANVSKSTVSQYLNGRYHYMSQATKDKIERVIEELDYEPNIVARSLKIKKTNTIGVILSNIQAPFFAQAVMGIEKLSLEKGYNVILCNTGNDSVRELEYLKMLKNKQVDGIIISYSGANRDFMEGFIKSDIPVVVFDKDIPDLNVPTVVSDNKSGAYKAVEHLFSRGFDDIGIISSNLKDIPSRMKRIEGYKEALAHKGVDFDKEKVFFFDEFKDFIPQMEEVFSTRRLPRAVFIFNYHLTMAFLKFCLKKNIRIPRDVALVAFDDLPFADLMCMPVTTVSQMDYEIGYESAKILFDLIEKDKGTQPVKKYFPCELIVRKSCGY